ncbi:hypothetical protein BDF14DRAFT_1917717 [Spinellus fusiger]|nr:hypothetical protein BDF14DRAFT_1917717 [Spinellus fusiger]
MFANILTPAFLFIASTYAVSCGKNHKAWVWNCQTILDNWSLNDNTVYFATKSTDCLFRQDDKYFGSIVCTLLKNDSCAVSISASTITRSMGQTGKQLKQFVKDSISQCTSNNLVSATQGNAINFYSQKMCLSSINEINSC